MNQNPERNYPGGFETCTFFAPTNEAFEDDPFVTKDRMLYHILYEEIKGEEFFNGQLLTTRYEIAEKLGDGKVGQKSKVEKVIEKLGQEVTYVGNGKIIQTDLQADNDSIDQLQIFTSYLRIMDLDNIIKVGNHITVFAPTDDSITKNLKHFEREFLTGNCGGGYRDLDRLIKHHLHYEDVLYTTNFTREKSKGEPLEVVRDENDVIHVANGLISYKDLLAHNATKFVSALIKYRLHHYIEDLETPYTILAPQDDYYDSSIFENLGSEDLKYHILPGKYKIHDFKDKMLVKTELITEELRNKSQRISVSVKSTWANEQKGDILLAFNEVYVIGDPGIQLSNFVSAIYASDMLSTVESSKGVSVFAPTNLAFSNLDLLIPYFLSPYGKDDLREVVMFHMLNDTVYTEDIPQGETQYTAIDGSPLNITRNEDHIKVKIENGTAEVIQRDILTSTGVMHVVDAVQLPPTLHITVGKILNGIGATSMLEVFKISNLSEILSDPVEPFTIFSPTNDAFRKINITKLMNDPDRVSRLIRLHVIPRSVGNLREGKELNTMLSDDAKLVVRKDILFGGYKIEVKGGFFEDSARILGKGVAWNGGAVYEVDKVLKPERTFPHIGRLFFFVVLGLLASITLCTLGGYIWHHWYLYRRRAGAGYTPIGPTE
ncbi:19460_t:CDS:2 [Racocetra fulgida]|uniref:19460_t:CDS:1 n=1 Tax=Racocetra fulgida TaxID=60492 RepID=A0A9N9F5Y7_9GLOM|nr:19460_t:CDS:2 [Racocetra fulgida]